MRQDHCRCVGAGSGRVVWVADVENRCDKLVPIARTLYGMVRVMQRELGERHRIARQTHRGQPRTALIASYAIWKEGIPKHLKTPP